MYQSCINLPRSYQVVNTWFSRSWFMIRYNECPCCSARYGWGPHQQKHCLGNHYCALNSLKIKQNCIENYHCMIVWTIFVPYCAMMCHVIIVTYPKDPLRKIGHIKAASPRVFAPCLAMPGPWKWSWKWDLRKEKHVFRGTVYYDILWLYYCIQIDDFSISYSMLMFFVWEFGGILHHPAIDRGWLLSFRADRDMSRPREIGSGFTPWKCGDSEIRTSRNVVKRREILELFDNLDSVERTDTTWHDMFGACLVHLMQGPGTSIASPCHTRPARGQIESFSWCADF